MTKKVFLLVGSPGAGKTWITNQLKREYTVVEHDDYIDGYIDEIVEASQYSTKPLLVNSPFGVTQLKRDLEYNGFEVTPVFVLEPEEVIAKRYHAREGKPIPQGHLARQKTYYQRAQELNAFKGNSEEVLKYLKERK